MKFAASHRYFPFVALLGIGALVPTTFGVLLRGLMLYPLSKRCGGFVWLQPRVMVIHSDRITFGKNFACNSGAYINGIGGITFGDFVLIGPNVTISSGRHAIDGAHPEIISRKSMGMPIVIEDDVWLGAGVVIMPGVRLAKGTVVGANAVVTRDTAPYAVVVGSPAREIKNRNDIH